MIPYKPVSAAADGAAAPLSATSLLKRGDVRQLSKKLALQGRIIDAGTSLKTVPPPCIPLPVVVP